jgi:hypothetical protein
MTTHVQRFLAVLGEPHHAQLCCSVLDLFSNMQWLLQYSHEEKEQYIRLCTDVIKAAKSSEDLSHKVQAVHVEADELLQQELAAQLQHAATAAASDASSSSFSARSSSSYTTSAESYSTDTSTAAAAAATAATFAEAMADAESEPDTPGQYEYSSGSAFGHEPGKAGPGSASSSKPAAAERAFGSSSSSFGSNSNTAAFGFDRQHDSGQPEQADSNCAWQQAYTLPLFGYAGAPAAGWCDTAPYAVFGDSNTAAAAGAGAVDALDAPITLPGSAASGGAANSIFSAAPEETLWRQQQDSSLFQQPDSSSSSSSFFAAASSLAHQAQDPSDAFNDFVARGRSGFPSADRQAACSSKHSSSSTGDGSSAAGDVSQPLSSADRGNDELCLADAAPGAASVPDKLGSVDSSTCSSMPLGGISSSGADYVSADSSMASASPAAVAAGFGEASGSSSGSARSGRAKALRCMSMCALVTMRILEGCTARCSAVCK